MALVATILGAMVAVTSAFNGLGPIAAGFVHDRTGSYSAIFVACVAIDCLAAALVYFLGHQPSRAATVEGPLLKAAE